MASKTTTHTTTVQVGGKDVKVNFAIRSTPKAEFADLLLREGISESQGVHEVQIGQDLFVNELGRTSIEQ